MSTPVNSHLDNISITVTLAALPVQAAGFGIVMLLVDQADGNTLDGDRVRTYTNATDAATDQAAAFISATVLVAIQTAFSQVPAPSTVKVGRIDTGGAETYATGYTAIKVEDDDFYGVVVDKRAAAEQLLVSAAVEAEGRLLFIQSDDADWLTTGLPAAYSDLSGRERTSVVYHDAATAWADMAMACRWLAFDPDEISAVAEGALKSVVAYTTAPTAAQKTFLDANYVNNGLPYGGDTFYIDAGVNISGRPLYEMLSADWFATRLQERIAALRTAKSARGEKIPVGIEGQALILSEMDGLAAVGVTAGHFTAGETRSVALDVTQADRDAGELRFTFEAEVEANTRLFSFSIYFSRAPLT